MEGGSLIQLRVPLENLMIITLAERSDRHLEPAREMAPRPGFTHHPPTTQAAPHTVDLVDRPIHYRSVHPS